MEGSYFNYGGFWRRTAAALIDQGILWCLYATVMIAGIVILSVGYGGYAFPWEHQAVMNAASRWMLAHQLLCITINATYFIYFHGAKGQTPGKMLLRLKVVQASGDEMTYGVAFLRWVGYLVSSVFLFVGYLWVAFDKRKQGWHDKIAATVVVSLPQGAEISLDIGNDII